MMENIVPLPGQLTMRGLMGRAFFPPPPADTQHARADGGHFCLYRAADAHHARAGWDVVALPGAADAHDARAVGDHCCS